ncbi:MAG: BBE domain-containing protein [Gemmatimonadota bacterium]
MVTSFEFRLIRSSTWSAQAVRGIPGCARLDRRPRLELLLEVHSPARTPRRPHRGDCRARVLLLVAPVVRCAVPSEGGGEPSGRGRDGVREPAGVARDHARWCLAARRGLRRFFAALGRFQDGVYVNFLGGDEGPERVREAYGDSVYDRLVAVKTTYDPDNVFHHNQNIHPLSSKG